jgi:hypothetical protein
LTKKCIKRITELTQDWDSELDGRKTAKEIQSLLIVLLALFLGGQRPQVLVEITIKVKTHLN